MSSRNYNKLYVHKNREEGSEKLLLGYESDTKEIILKKDKENSFHIPYYTASIGLAQSTLIADGATPGPFPAAADRIFENRKGYGNITSNGPSSEYPNGTWYCSWLCEDSNGIVKWKDRIYNPGYIPALSQLYLKHDPAFEDIDSTMVLEPGVQYRYVHVGEEMSAQIVDTFSGKDKTRLRLNLEQWGTPTIDTSINNIPVKIIHNEPFDALYPTVTETDRVSGPVISFNHEYSPEVSFVWDDSYASAEEFTWTFWAYSDNWNESQSTQLIGNCSTNGGIGLFIDTLSSYPFFVIPVLAESTADISTNWGHLLYVNNKFGSFKDKNIPINHAPKCIGLDSDDNVVIFNVTGATSASEIIIQKLDNVGTVIKKTSTPCVTNNSQEIPRQLICGPNDTVIAITDKTRYTYNANLDLISTTLWTTLSTTVAAYMLHNNGSTELISTDGVYDSKFIGTAKWYIPISNGMLYRKYPSQPDELFAKFPDIATQFGIDPYNRIWVLHGTNKVSVYNSLAENLKDPLFQFEAGADFAHEKKHISFVCTYERSTGTREWKCLIYYSNSGDSLIAPQIYVYDMNGSLVRTVDVLSLFDPNLIKILNQQQTDFRFYSSGDFTGYERKRIFNSASPLNNSAQLILKACLKDSSKTEFPFTWFKISTPIEDWSKNSWHHFVLTLQNRTFKLYTNGLKVGEMSYGGQYDISYELQPSFFIGSPVGNQAGFNQEIKETTSIFNGLFQDIKIYDYAINPGLHGAFLRKSVRAQDIYWTFPTPSIQYVEQIERMFKNKIPGAKATFFNIKLCGTQIKDPQTRSLIEQELRLIASKIKPAYTEFLKVVWID